MSELLEFHDKLDEEAQINFHHRRQRHWNSGYFLNYQGPSNTTLHKADCSHYKNKYWNHGDKTPAGKSMTASKKICSTDSDELRGWAAKKDIKTLKKCSGNAGCF